MALPRNIKKEIIEYLHLEFGEDASDPHAITASDLKYVGSRKQGRAEIHFWVFASGHRRRWATATITKSGCSLGTSEEGPDGESDIGASPDAIYIDFPPATRGQKPMKSIRLPVPKDYEDNGMSLEIPIILPTGESFDFFVEMYPPRFGDGSLSVSLGISQDGDDGFYFRSQCTTGLIFQCTLGGYNWSIQIGTGPWS